MATRKPGQKNASGRRSTSAAGTTPAEPRTYDHPEAKTLLRPDVGTQSGAVTKRLDAEMRDSGTSGRVPQGDPKTRDMAAFQEDRGTGPEVPHVPQNGIDAPVELVPTSPAFVPKEEDKMVPDDLHDDLTYYYAKSKDVKAALHALNLGNRYFRHASWILEDRGLKARKA